MKTLFETSFNDLPINLFNLLFRESRELFFSVEPKKTDDTAWIEGRVIRMPLLNIESDYVEDDDPLSIPTNSIYLIFQKSNSDEMYVDNFIKEAHNNCVNKIKSGAILNKLFHNGSQLKRIEIHNLEQMVIMPEYSNDEYNIRFYADSDIKNHFNSFCIEIFLKNHDFYSLLFNDLVIPSKHHIDLNTNLIINVDKVPFSEYQVTMETELIIKDKSGLLTHQQMVKNVLDEFTSIEFVQKQLGSQVIKQKEKEIWEDLNGALDDEQQYNLSMKQSIDNAYNIDYLDYYINHRGNLVITANYLISAALASEDNSLGQENDLLKISNTLNPIAINTDAAAQLLLSLIPSSSGSNKDLNLAENNEVLNEINNI